MSATQNFVMSVTTNSHDLELTRQDHQYEKISDLGTDPGMGGTDCDLRRHSGAAMTIWKCASGGYHSGESCQDEFKAWRIKHPTARGNDKLDIQLVRLVERHELAAHLSEIGHFVDPDTIDAVLRGLVELTPSGTDKSAWAKLHRG